MGVHLGGGRETATACQSVLPVAHAPKGIMHVVYGVLYLLSGFGVIIA